MLSRNKQAKALAPRHYPKGVPDTERGFIYLVYVYLPPWWPNFRLFVAIPLHEQNSQLLLSIPSFELLQARIHHPECCTPGPLSGFQYLTLRIYNAGRISGFGTVRTEHETSLVTF